MERVAMPQLGETVTEGTIVQWLKQPGDRVEVDDGLFEVSTEKVDTEVPSAVAGYLRRILVGDGETVPVGTVLALLTSGADDPLDDDPLDDDPGDRSPIDDHPAGPLVPTAADGTAPPRDHTAAPAPVGADRPATRGSTGAGSALSPVVRGLLVAHGLDPLDVVGSGRDGRITRNDVLAAAANRRDRPRHAGPDDQRAPLPPAVAGPDDTVVEMSRARRNTAANMLRSVATSVHTLVATEVDYHRVDAVRRSAGLAYLPFVARAVVDAIGEFPNVNSSVGDGELLVHPRVHLGIAVDVDLQALVVPVLRDAGSLRLPALAAAVADLAARARSKRIGLDELAGGTFTITNVGSYGTLVSAPIINQPEVAILSTDGVRMQPVAVRLPGGPSGEAEWGVAVHPVGNLCLTFDHRAFDGAYAAAFLARVRDIVENRDWAPEVGP